MSNRTQHQRIGVYENVSLSILAILLALYAILSSNDPLHSLDLDHFAGPRVTRDGQTTGGAKGNSAGSCRMTWMSPSYLPIRSVKSKFHSKYSLHLYREHDWDLDHDPSRSPVLFIPGNAGSFRQVRSLAAVTATTYFRSPQSPHSDYLKRRHPGLDFFTLDFNDEFSAFHGQTLVQQAEFANDAIREILSIYQQTRIHTNTHLPVPSSVLIIGHSMGGILARRMLTMPNYVNNSINTIISLSSPHSIPPITFESGIERIYESINNLWRKAFSAKADRTGGSYLQEVVLVSIAGGSSDATVSSDSSSLLSLAPSTSSLTVFTTGIPGVWTPIDHLAILWCNQLAIVIAKALLQVIDPLLPPQVGSVQQRLHILRSHFVLGHGIEPFPVDIDEALKKFQIGSLPTNSTEYTLHSQFQSLRFSQANLDATDSRLQTHIIPLLQNQAPGLEFTLLSTLVANHELNVLACKGSFETHFLQSCSSISARDSHLLPQSRFNLTPIATPGPYDRAEPPLVSTFVQIPLAQLGQSDFIAIQIYKSHPSSPQDRSNFLVSEFRNISSSTISTGHSFWKFCLFGTSFRLLPTQPSLVSEVKLPSLINSLVAFKLDLTRGNECDTKGLFAPLMRQETPLLSESKYHPNIRSAILFTHFSRSYTPIRILSTRQGENLGVRLTFWLDSVYCGGSSGESHSLEIRIKIDFYESARRIVVRYRTAFVSFPLGILSLVLSIQLRKLRQTGIYISFNSATTYLVKNYLLKTLYLVAVLQFLQSFVLNKSSQQRNEAEFSLINLPYLLSDLLLGQTEWLFILLLWLIILASVGCTISCCFILNLCFRFFALLVIKLLPSKQNDLRKFERQISPSSNNLLLFLVGLGIFNVLFAPYHFTFIVLTVLQLFNTFRSLIACLKPSPSPEKSMQIMNESERNSWYQYNKTILVIMIWLLPISITIFLVWLRNLQEGHYEPFSDGRNLACVVGFMSLFYLNHHGQSIGLFFFKYYHNGHFFKPWYQIHQPMKLIRILETMFIVIASICILYGVRYTFLIFHLFNLAFLSLFFLLFFTSPKKNYVLN